MDLSTLWPYTLAIAILAQLAIWWFDRKDPTKLKWLRRLMKSLPIRASETQWLQDIERERRKLARHALCGTVNTARTPGPLETRVGGPLIVPKGREVPTNAFGRPLLPLLLIRLPDLPDTQGNVLPPMGWIQVLVEASSFGDVETPIAQGASFRILRFSEGTEFDIYPVDRALSAAHPAWEGTHHPAGFFETGLGIDFEPLCEVAPLSHYKLDMVLPDFSTRAFDDAFDALDAELEKELAQGDVIIGGHMHFTQDDVRGWGIQEGFENLIRMSAEGSLFSWYDVGEATIMVPAEDLRTARLQNAVLYYDYH